MYLGHDLYMYLSVRANEDLYLNYPDPCCRIRNENGIEPYEGGSTLFH